MVDVVPQFPEESNGLDFGDVRVGEMVEKNFQVSWEELGCLVFVV